MAKVGIEDLFVLKSVSQTLVSNSHYFYLETKIDVEQNTYLSAVYSLTLKTNERKLWSNQNSKNSLIKTSPNGKYLSYLSNNTDNNQMQVVLIPIDGGAQRQITFEKNGVTDFHWTSNSSQIYYVTSQKALSVTSENSLPTVTVIDKLSYKEDGSGIIPGNTSYQIKKLGVCDQKEEVCLESTNPVQLNYLAKDESFLILSDPLDEQDEWRYGQTLYYHDVQSGERYSLTASIPKGSFAFFEMNQEETHLLLVGNDFNYGFVTQQKLYVYDFKEHELRCLTTDLDVEVNDSIIGDFQQNLRGVQPIWLTNHSYLFPTTEEGRLKLYKGELGQGDQLFIDEPLHITELSLDADNQQLFICYTTPILPSALGTIDLVTGEIKESYNPNLSYCQQTEIVEPQEFWYQGAEDWPIQGWYLPPVATQEKHPAILYIHGGPQVCYGASFFHEMQVHSANGFGVMLLNPRGGMGYGQEFVKAILGDYGNQDYLDLMLGVDALLAKYPEIDSEALYVAGGSYGGFMTNWIIGHTQRFKRGVTQRSISNWLSFYGTSDIGAFFVNYQLQRNLEQGAELWQMSPLAHLSNITTPLLVLHGQEDLRCPLEQGEQMYIGMKSQGVETKMITFPQSSHGLSRTGLPNLRKSRLESIVQWFSKK
ncbi:S9 family peptidase [Vagococcus salmoninarum]|uniref:S9 family peptidase n=3 Tax=Vagococcus salmoninarum TaxID=2739 RepID=UPI003F985760